MEKIITAPTIKRAGKRDTRAPYLERNDWNAKTRSSHHVLFEAALKGAENQVLKPLAAEHCCKTLTTITHYNTSYRAFFDTDYKSFKTLLSNNDYPCRGVPASPSVLDKKLITYRFPEKISRASKWEIAVFPFPLDIWGKLKANVSFWGLNRLIVL